MFKIADLQTAYKSYASKFILPLRTTVCIVQYLRPVNTHLESSHIII